MNIPVKVKYQNSRENKLKQNINCVNINCVKSRDDPTTRRVKQHTKEILGMEFRGTVTNPDLKASRSWSPCKSGTR